MLEVKEAPRLKATIPSLGLRSTQTDPRILGVWTSECLRDPTHGNGVKVELSVEKDHFIQSMNAYSDTGCSSRDFELKAVGSYSMTDREFTIVTELVSTTMFNSLMAKAASDAGSCGFNKWMTGIEYDVTNLKCPATGSGLTITGNQRGTKSVALYKISVTVDGYALDLEGSKLTRRKRSDEVTIPVLVTPPVETALFADEYYKKTEAMLRLKGCEIGLDFGIRDCDRPEDLEEAAEMYALIGNFGIGILNDSRFRNNKEAQNLLQKGYYGEREKVTSFEPYRSAQEHHDAQIAEFKKLQPALTVYSSSTIHVIAAQKGLEMLKEVVKQARFNEEMARLKVKTIYFNERFYFGLGTAEQGNYLFLNVHDFATSAWTGVLATPTPTTPAPIGSITGPLSAMKITL
ncbi:MAG TPA: hypothetical protein VE954_38525 [Oligoflexus sp.]|nr:hypothetical protein [Oligoflexus sp.]